MIRRKFLIPAITSILVLSLALAGCSEPADEVEMVTVTFALGGSSRATGFGGEISDYNELEHYVTITGPSGENIPAPVTKGDIPTVTATGPAGSWLIEVQAVRTPFAGLSSLYALYSHLHTVNSGTSINITMQRPADFITANSSLSLAVPLTAPMWSSIFNAIDNSTATAVTLNLSRCTDGGSGAPLFNGTFDPGSSLTGKDKVSTLILPNAATEIIGSSGPVPFAAFTGLTSVIGSGIIDIGERAFWEADQLTDVSFPELKNIDDDAFNSAFALTNVNFPKVETIGDSAFFNCDIGHLDLPNVVTIGTTAFSGNSNLNSITISGGATLDISGWDTSSRYATFVDYYGINPPTSSTGTYTHDGTGWTGP